MNKSRKEQEWSNGTKTMLKHLQKFVDDHCDPINTVKHRKLRQKLNKHNILWFRQSDFRSK